MHKTHRIYHLCLLSTVGLTLPKTQVYILNPQNMAKTSDNNHDKTPRLTMSKYSHGNCVIINLHTNIVNNTEINITSGFVYNNAIPNNNMQGK